MNTTKKLIEQLEKETGKKVALKETVSLEEVEFISADHRDIEGLGESFKNALVKFGVYVYDDPMQEGSDQYGYILSKRKLTKREVLQVSKELENDIFGEDEE